MDNKIVITTIFTPNPLFNEPCKKTIEHTYINYFKQATIPLTCCFFYTINKNNMLTDITKNPYITVFCAYFATHYYIHLTLQNEQDTIDQNIIDAMQHVFHLLIIGHGLYNKITTPLCYPYKIEATLNLSTLELFLQNAHHTWDILFSYYQEHYKDKALYQYQLNQINMFEILQACHHEPDVLPFITKFYDKNNRNYDYEPIINCLEIKLKLINHKLKSFLPIES